MVFQILRSDDLAVSEYYVDSRFVRSSASVYEEAEYRLREEQFDLREKLRRNLRLEVNYESSSVQLLV